MAQAIAAPPVDPPRVTSTRRSTVLWVVLLAHLGMIFDGYDLVVYGAVLPQFMDPGIAPPLLGETVDKATGGLLGSYALFGVLVGALLAGTLADKLGRRKLMLASIAWFSIGMGVTAMTSTTTSFGLMRFVTGIGIGALMATTGALVAEFAPPGKKYFYNSIVYCGVPLGSLLSAFLAIILLPSIGWRGMFLIGALPFVTLLPLALWKMPESVAWLTATGRHEEARRVSEKTGIPLPDVHQPVQASAAIAEPDDSRSGWAGLFTAYLIPTIVLGLVSATCMLLVYSLNTWLPTLMKPILGQSGSLSLLLVLNAGAVFGSLFGSRFADRFGPRRVVATCFFIGAVGIAIIGLLSFTIGPPPAPPSTITIGAGLVGLLLVTVAVVGLGTSGTQTLIFGMVANFYRTNVRGAGVAWCAGFGRLGGVGGPILGGLLAATFATSLWNIFYVLAGVAVLGMVLTLVVPMRKAHAVASVIKADASAASSAEPTEVRGARLYDTIMVVVDETGNEVTRSRVSEFARLTGKKVYLVYLARERVISGEVLSSVVDARGGGNDVQIDPVHAANLQDYVNRVNAGGVPATGKVLSATLFARGDAVVDLARQVGADLIILNTEHGGQRAKAQLAQEVAKNNPKVAVLIARSIR